MNSLLMEGKSGIMWRVWPGSPWTVHHSQWYCHHAAWLLLLLVNVCRSQASCALLHLQQVWGPNQRQFLWRQTYWKVSVHRLSPGYYSNSIVDTYLYYLSTSNDKCRQAERNVSSVRVQLWADISLTKGTNCIQNALGLYAACSWQY